MAEAISTDQDPFSCSLCLDLMKNPVTISCGHSYCMDCINDCWDKDSQKDVRCPQCRQTFRPRPRLNKNFVLAEVVSKIQKGGRRNPEYEVKPGDVECDFCTGRKFKAVKSCLVCLASYCMTHIQPHYESLAFERHKLVETSSKLPICPDHDKLLEVYCRTDQQCICLLCVMDEHKAHNTVSATAERNEKQKLFGKKEKTYQQFIQDKEKELRELKQTMKTLKSVAGAAVDDSEKAFTEMILSIERQRSDVKERIKSQEKTTMSRGEGLQNRLERDIAELRRRHSELMQLSLTKDNIHFLQSFPSHFDCPTSDVMPGVAINLHIPLDSVKKVIFDLKESLDNMSKNIAEMSQKLQVDPDPKTRNEFVMYSCQLTLDPNTAFENLLLSEGNSKVTWCKKAQEYPDHPDRFTQHEQILCIEGLSSTYYWEVELKGPRVEVIVSYKGLGLEECAFGYSDQDWCLTCSHSRCSFWHNGLQTKIVTPCSSRVGVYLNHKVGALSFYSVSNSDTMTLLHRVQTSFSQPIYPGFMVTKGSSVKILQPK
ncbi:tripartite motif-containing protein 16-like [Aplochiton taeniatus]